MFKDILFLVSFRAMLHLFEALAPVGAIRIAQLLFQRVVTFARVVSLLLGWAEGVGAALYGIFVCHVTEIDSVQVIDICGTWILVASRATFGSARLTSERLLQWVEESGWDQRHIFLLFEICLLGWCSSCCVLLVVLCLNVILITYWLAGCLLERCC